ncbi:hypothetical protein JG688_00005397 [Phytophthora aleatoria]|uniref:DNA replication ATP-dependent helicase/nuclease n=1 Tax=Phytophthora aleatoria TaxID=2496075 RepID=A0A8J5IMK6_9STRA|nr:hypothetical protein JG688_00005397 [Phytophthora aleatoria]
MDTTRTPKRKRRRLESGASRRGSKKTSSSSSSANRTPGSGGNESKIVWKDSPADKQIKVSGTGKMAVRREMQGFVGRLARASQQSPPSSSEEEKKPSRERVRTRRKVAQHEEEKAASRHLMFSPPERGATGQRTPNTARRRRSTERGDSQDELFNVLDQMEQKYASPNVALPLTDSRALPSRKPQQYQQQQQLPSSAAASASTDDVNMTPTPAASYSSTGTQSPRSLRTQEAGKTQERTRNQAVVKALEAIKEQEALKTPEEPPVVDVDPFDDLTDESWALLDQLQSQRAPVEASQAQSQSQTEIVSPQNLALTPRPMPSAAYSDTKKPPPMPPALDPASVVRPMHVTGAAQQLETSESFKRFLVLEVDCDVVNRSLFLRLLDDQDAQLEAVLNDDWYDVLVEAGDTINIVFTEQDKDGFFSQDGYKTSMNRQLSRILVDNAHNVVVVHPDILVSPTRVTTSFGCLRRAVLQETLAVNRPTNKKAFLGTLKHDLFEHALLNGLNSAEALLEEAKRIVNSNILGLVECGLNEEEALFELQRVIEDYRLWVNGAMMGPGTPLSEIPHKNGAKARVSRVLSTEEMMWSIKWGLKGATDASVEGTIDGERAGSVVLPLELKTGSKKYAGVEHQGQVILYTLLLNERYRQRCQDGLLIYVPPIETNRITAMATHVRGLIMTRNNFASAIAKVKSIVDECVLHHVATENGTEGSSGLDELFTLMTKHLGEADLNYFKQWNRLIDLEQQHAEKNLRALWLQVGWKREQAQEGSTCVANLKMVSDAPALSESGAKRTLRFVRDRRTRRDNGDSGVNSQPTSFADVRFRVDERVILSAESLDGKNLLVHVSRASVRKIEHGLITIESRQSIPSIVKNGQSAVGKEYTWRLDKDAIMSGLRPVDNLLLKLLAYKTPMLRIGNTAQVHPLIADFTLDRQAEREGISSVRAMEAKMVNAQLVGCTCLSVNSHVLFAKRRFDFCIVDEATQITQPIILSALRCADTFVLVGDHYQLPPLVANAQARKEGMDVSLFRRLAEAHPEATQQLSYQYRMNRDIMLVANRLVYGDKLKCGSFKVASNHLKPRWQRQDTVGHKLLWPIRVLTNNQGVMFLDTDAMGEATAESSSTAQLGTSGRRRMENVVEAQVIAGLVELLVLGSVPPDEIAVISPFRSQVALIHHHLTAVAAFRRAGGSDWVHSIEVSTIDKYQGKDKGVILVSFVRCNEEKHVGELLTDWRRINVALTRAKQKLLLVGSEATLSGGSALFHVLSGVIKEQQWGFKLPRDAVETLRQFAVSVAAPVEPDPEQGTTPGPRSSRATDNVKVSILQRSTASGNGDIESLVPDLMRMVLFLLLMLVAGVAKADELIYGGWSSAAITPDTRAVLLQALSTTNVCVSSIVSVKSQVVAGTNYEFRINGCRGMRGGNCARSLCKSPRALVVSVFDQPWTRTIRVESVSEA